MPERVQVCRCGMFFVFRKHHHTGKVAPIEKEPDPKGNIVLLANGTYRVLAKGEAYEGDRFRNHFMSCPSRHKFRKKG